MEGVCALSLARSHSFRDSSSHSLTPCRGQRLPRL